MNTIVAKFGGTSLADAEQFRKIKRIVEEGPGRRILVASAPGKRFPEDTKVTDLLDIPVSIVLGVLLGAAAGYLIYQVRRQGT